MKLSELATILHGTLQGADSEYKRIVIDSRVVQKDDCFFAIKGEFFDGHDFIVEVAQKGASVAVVDHAVVSDIPIIIVANTRKALIDLARFYRETASIPVVAITGSCGKTTTRAMLENILKQSSCVLASQKSFNNDIGLPLTLLQLKPDHHYLVLEIGTNHPGEIAALTNIAKPTLSVVTMIAGVHTEGFGSIENIAVEKAEIYAGLSEDGVAVVNADDPFADYFKKIANRHRVITFGTDHQAGIMAKDVSIHADGKINFTLQIMDKTVFIALPLLGEHNVVNALAAAAVAFALAIPIQCIKQGLESVQPEYGRLVMKKSIMGANIIDDSYNANPTSVKAAIRVLTHQSSDPILVLGDMKELGKDVEALHAAIGEFALQQGVKKLFCYGAMSVFAAKAFGKNAFYFDDQQQLLEALKLSLTKDTTVLVKGSHSMKMKNIVDAIVI